MARIRRLKKAGCAALAGMTLVALVASGARAQNLPSPAAPTREFDFARLVYPEGYGGFGYRGRGSWTTDYPEAEFFFHKGVSRLTRVDMDEEKPLRDRRGHVLIELDDDRLFDYPFLYGVEVGRWYLGETEAARLREYLLRGGFLMVDDFHGSVEWARFLDSMTRVFPDRPIVDIEDSHEILHVVYDVDERTQVPGIVSIMSGTTYERDGRVPHWRGIYDDDGRLMVIINHNMDLGDAWEHADDPIYPQEMTTLALHFAVNYVIYAMTH